MKIETQTKLLRLKSLLNHISDVSYAFNLINKKHPMNSLDEERAMKVISAYIQLLSDVRKSVESYAKNKEL